jgi:hypothetical protein
MGRSFLRTAAMAGIALILLCTFFVIARHPFTYQWDLSTYYYAAKAYQTGQNPYDRDVLSEIAGTAIRLKFVYPPHTLPVLEGLTILSYPAMHPVWLGLKALFLMALFRAWMRLFPGSSGSPGFLLFALLAFNGAVLSDLVAGNISIMEQACVWGGFLFLLQKRRLEFAVMMGLAAFFKITYAWFFVLLLFPPTKENVRALLVGILLVAAPLVLSATMTPSLFGNFLSNAAAVGDVLERGNNNPCLFAFLLTIADLASDAAGGKIPLAVVLALFGIHAVVILSLVGRAARDLLSRGGPEPLRDMIFLACLTYPLIVPRFKDYSYILLIPAGYELFRRLGTGRLEGAMMMFILVVPTFTLFSGLLPLTEYYLFFAGYALFWWYLALVRRPVPTSGVVLSGGANKGA